MFNTTDILTLGTEYTVVDRKGNTIQTLQLIPQSEILEAAVGPFSSEFNSYTEYLEAAVGVLSGFEDIDPLKILWFSSYEEELILSDLVEFAIKNGYDRIILEKLVDD